MHCVERNRQMNKRDTRRALGTRLGTCAREYNLSSGSFFLCIHASSYPHAFSLQPLFFHTFSQMWRKFCQCFALANSHDWCGSWPLTFLHNSESHFTNCATNIWWVLHLAGECPVVSGLQIPDHDGNIVTLNIPIPGDSLFKPSSRQLVGLLEVIKYLQAREEAVIPTHCAVSAMGAAREGGVALAEAHGLS